MTDYEKLKVIIDEIDDLINHHVRSSVPTFEAWHTKAERFLIRKYGENSFEHKKFTDTYFTSLVWGDNDIDDMRLSIQSCADGLRSCKAAFEIYLEDIEDEENHFIAAKTTTHETSFDKVFIVHGHDGELKQSVARLIEKQSLNAVILSEQANKGKTIIEKFEENSDVSGAICLFTADDFGRAKNDSTELPRARQNVVFEAGYFMGKLSRSRVVIIAEKGVELPSDMQGIVYTDKANWEIDVLKEMKAMGYSIDFNKFFN